MPQFWAPNPHPTRILSSLFLFPIHNMIRGPIFLKLQQLKRNLENHQTDNARRFQPQPQPYNNYSHDSRYGVYSSEHSSTTPTPIPMASYSSAYPHHYHSVSSGGPPQPIVPSSSPSISSSSPSQSPIQDFHEPEFESSTFNCTELR
ncbi:hypothetical protein F5050DRAFT_1808827 [Lentinula boryana]|uniref:Uncharacterized protein n=1 Tax=Lentinula boryana TaxID=40481 RepID=A0ABQ8Q9V5_9AGAR|nr:hypothetical protein F5050DRAFT_1808827 [Lentinula boryana]